MPVSSNVSRQSAPSKRRPTVTRCYARNSQSMFDKWPRRSGAISSSITLPLRFIYARPRLIVQRSTSQVSKQPNSNRRCVSMLQSRRKTFVSCQCISVRGTIHGSQSAINVPAAKLTANRSLNRTFCGSPSLGFISFTPKLGLPQNAG